MTALTYKYSLSFIVLSCLVFFLIFMIMKIRASLRSNNSQAFGILIKNQFLSNKDSLIVLFLTFCGIMMVAYTSVIGGGFVAGYWLQGESIYI